MSTALFIGGLMVIATAFMIATRHLHNCDLQMKLSLEENNRIDFLSSEAMKMYPQFPELKAMQHYLWDLEERIETLKRNALGTDVLYAIESDLKDSNLIRREIERTIRMEIEFNSHFNVLHSASL